MDDKIMYAISFKPEKINEKHILLKPNNLLEGVLFDDNLIVDNEQIYHTFNFTNDIDKYNRMYGLGVTKEDLLLYTKMCGFPDSIKEDIGICVKTYLKVIQKYVFLLEKKGNNFSCFAIRIEDKKKIENVNLNQNAILQFTDMFTAGEELENLKKKIEQDALIEKNKNYFDVDDLYHKITKRVIGQDEAAYVLASSIYKKIRYKTKSNILIYGPTGCGKTELVRALADELNLSVIIEDMNQFSATGYVGDSVKTILRRAYSAANYDMTKAENSIIVLDEIDKLASNDPRENVKKQDVQNELLKMIEGGKYNLNDSDGIRKDLIMDTSNIIFIMCGAFTEFQEKQKKRPIGFTANIDSEEILSSKTMDNDDFKAYGLKSEFIGRAPVKVPIRALNVEDYKRILEESSISRLKMYKDLIRSIDNVQVLYEGDFINAVAEKAVKLGVGARGIESIIENVFMYALPNVKKELPDGGELVLFSETVEDAKVYELRKKKGVVKNELSKRNGASN